MGKEYSEPRNSAGQNIFQLFPLRRQLIVIGPVMPSKDI
jgi:hypothetical protein